MHIMDIHEIQKYIPHRYPFLFVDRVLSLEKGHSIIATKNISASDLILQGHFPHHPVFPGVLIIEGLAQASGILGSYSSENTEQETLLTEVTHTRFKRKVEIGDVLQYEVTLLKKREPFFWFKGVATVESHIVATCEFSAYLK